MRSIPHRALNLFFPCPDGESLIPLVHHGRPGPPSPIVVVAPVAPERDDEDDEDDDDDEEEGDDDVGHHGRAVFHRVRPLGGPLRRRASAM